MSNGVVAPVMYSVPSKNLQIEKKESLDLLSS